MRNVMKTVALSTAAVGLALSGAGVAAADAGAIGTACTARSIPMSASCGR